MPERWRTTGGPAAWRCASSGAWTSRAARSGPSRAGTAGCAPGAAGCGSPATAWSGPVPDDADRLREVLVAACDRGADVIVTTGGTGIGPRDITPDVVGAMADRALPGIMEHIRTRYGATRPAALLSRSVAAVAGRALIYTLPGSPRAVEEYLAEILKTLEYAICVLNGLDPH